MAVQDIGPYFRVNGKELGSKKEFSELLVEIVESGVIDERTVSLKGRKPIVQMMLQPDCTL